MTELQAVRAAVYAAEYSRLTGPGHCLPQDEAARRAFVAANNAMFYYQKLLDEQRRR